MSAYRTPRTRQERRAFEAALSASAEYGVHIAGIRAKRSPRHLPTDWSDKPCARKGRCWKAYRRTQWRARKPKLSMWAFRILLSWCPK